MARKQRTLKKLKLREVVAFKIANRRGYAVVARNNLTEGRTLCQAYGRLVKACRRNGYELPVRTAPELSAIRLRQL